MQLLHNDGQGYVDDETARVSIKTVSDLFDSHLEVLVMLSHDNSILEENEFFPENLNGWKEKNWKKERLWNFWIREILRLNFCEQIALKENVFYGCKVSDGRVSLYSCFILLPTCAH
jgi:hypothetical protein